MGQTRRQLKTRIQEHTSMSYPSVVKEHLIQNDHTIGWQDIIILDHESNYYKRSISEMLHIKSQKNALNLQTDTMFLNNGYSDRYN